MRPASTIVAACAAVFVSAVPAFGQVQVSPATVAGPIQIGATVADLAALDLAFRTGDFALAEKQAGDLIVAARTAVQGDATVAALWARLDRAKETGPKGALADALDPKKNIIAVVWVSEDVPGKLVVRRLHLPRVANHRNALDLPGVSAASGKSLYEFFVAADRLSVLRSGYTFTREESEVAAQLPAFAERIAGPLFTLVSALRSAEDVAPRARASAWVSSHVFATITRVTVPYSRASVQWTARAVVPMAEREFRERAEALASKWRLVNAPHSPAAADFAADLATTVVEVAGSQVCWTESSDGAKCLKAFADQLTAHYDNATNPGLSKEDKNNIDADFRRFVFELKPLEVETQAAFRNIPPIRATLGVAAGVVLKDWPKDTRVDLSDGMLVADPMRSQLAMVTVNWTPWGYDADAFHVSRAERFRLFGGAVLTPDFGVGVGGAVLLARGLAINAGVAWLFFRAPDDKSQVGGPPADPQDPFSLGYTTAVILGVSYNFK
jgi:hypothetical protein